MIVVVIGVMTLLGATTWLSLNQSMARDPVRHRRLTAAGLRLCLAAAVGLLMAAAVTMS